MHFLSGSSAVSERAFPTPGPVGPAAPGGPGGEDDRIDSYDFEIPDESIARRPAPRRDGSRLMVLPRCGGEYRHARFADLPSELRPGDLLVVNDTRVIPARLHGFRAGGGRTEVLLVRPVPGEGVVWEAMVRPSARVGQGARIRFALDEEWTATAIDAGGGGARRVRFDGPGDFGAFLDRRGRLPLPPYIDRPDDEEDRDRYQTVFAREPGAVAAPTAGLHFTPSLVESLKGAGVGVASLTLHVGPGTFLPVRTERISDHPMHSEPYRVPVETARAVSAALAGGGRIVAVGSTACRALEAWHGEGRPEDGAFRETRLALWPGRPPRLVSALLTNFHLPRSTLLALVSAFAGRGRVLAAYRAAAEAGYRFYSYGDAMLLV